MQTILGAGGQIANGLARALHGTDELRLVSRKPHAVNADDATASADLTDATQTSDATVGSDVIYFTAGLPADTELWEKQFETMLRNALDAARTAGAKFVYFDNTYMYPQDARVQTEDTPFDPVGRKGVVRARMAQMVLDEIDRGEMPTLIARAPEFYGPERTQGFTNSLVFDRVKQGKRPLIPVRADTRRSLIWTPDASRALAALGSTPDAYGQTWHLPVDAAPPTYREIIATADQAFGTSKKAIILPSWALRAAGRISPAAREMGELLPRYHQDNIFSDAKFRTAFPDFRVTALRDGIDALATEH